MIEEAPNLDAFRSAWVNPRLRRELLARLPDGGRSAELVRRLADMDAFDLYDVLAKFGYGMAPKTQEERADAWGYKNATWLRACPEKTNAALRALVRQFARSGTDALESPSVLQTPEVRAAGGLTALQMMGKPPAELLYETKERVFTA